MRYESEWFLSDKIGQRRVVRKFLLLPRNFNDGKYSRWLEYADIVEEVKMVFHVVEPWGYDRPEWVEIGFADETPAPATGEKTGEGE
jgi:hypothetical protein